MRVPYRDLAWEHGQFAGDLTPVLARVAKSGRYLLGPELDAFESEFAAYAGSRHCG
ncbi:MAG: DegT/DnrJ/EryC1/StrS family aminotransferase [Acidimicrobiales bacterium]